MSNKKAIVTGADGQDGSFMVELLEAKGYTVFKIVRDNLRYLPTHIRDFEPDEIYNFAGISQVISPFTNLAEVNEINAQLPAEILQSIYVWDKNIRFFQASSSLIFGRDTGTYQNEQTPFNPIYPYGAAKLYAHNMVREYRENFGMFAVNGILFPHESERRKEHFFSRKITRAAARKEQVIVGTLQGARDYGYAGDYVKAAWMMLQAEVPKDYVIGTGQQTDLTDFAKYAFLYSGLDYRKYVQIVESEKRKNDTRCLLADYSAINKDLGWEPTTTISEMIQKMIQHDRTT